MQIPFRKKFILALCSSALMLVPISPTWAANYNYGEALQKSIFFYDVQRLGKLSTTTGALANRLYWRSDAFLQDYALPNEEGNIDLGGGFADAGDNVKFNFPMAASTTLLAWSVIEYRDAFVTSNQLTPMLANLRWATDYLLKSWDATNKRLYGQVSPDSVQAEHSNLWMPFEVIDQASFDKNLPRRAFYVDTNHPGTDLAGETVAALTAASIAFQSIDAPYAAQLLTAAKSIYNNLVNVPNKGKYSDNMGRLQNGTWLKADVAPFYNSWSGYNDEVSWASTWLYRATMDTNYLTVAKQYLQLGNSVATLSWDDKSYGVYLLLAKLLPASDPIQASAKASAESWLNAWAQGTNGHIFSKDGLAIASALSPWGNARYAATTAFGALIYDTYFGSKAYDAFAKSQIDYILGNNSKQFSYLTGFGNLYSKQPHHATAEGRWGGNNDVSYPGDNRHILYGGLVGGPKDANDTYEDNRNDYIGNEVALDYNAGLVGALAALYAQYGGTPLPAAQFPPTRLLENPPADEYFVNAGVQSSYIDATHSTVQVDMLATNHSAWPARVSTNLKIRYFMNLADKPSNGAVTVGVFSTDPRAVVSTPQLYDAAKQIYYVEVWFKDIPIYPGGDDRAISSKETQLQFQFNWPHDFTKDWSYQQLNTQGGLKATPYIPIYDVVNGSTKLLYGNEPTSVPQGNLTLAFGANTPAACVGAKDVINIGNGNSPTFSIGTTPFTYSMSVGGPFPVSLNSTTTPIAVTGGQCQGSLNATQVSIPGQLTANYTFVPTPPVDKGTLQVAISPTSDPKCATATDMLFIDQSATGLPFSVANGISQLLNTGAHTVKLTSQTQIPAGATGYCTSTLDKTQVTVIKNQTATATATYQFHTTSTGASCTITTAKVTDQANWGPTGIVNTIQVVVNLQGFPNTNGKITLNGTFNAKNNLVQNFWGNFNMTSSSFNKNVGTFAGEVWQNSFGLGGFIYNTVPLKIGDNPLQSVVVNGITCQ